MSEIFSRLDNEQILGVFGMGVGVVAILAFAAVIAATIVMNTRRRGRLDEMEVTLKLEMIQRGMSADEIKEVLGAELAAGQGWGGEQSSHGREKYGRLKRSAAK